MADRYATVRDMTEGKPMKLLLGFSLPLLFGNLFQQFYTLVDTMIVGRFLGKYALAGVGSTGSVNFLIIGFCMGVCGGFAIPIAQRFGAKDYAGLRRFVANAVWLSAGLAVVLTAVVGVSCRQILTVMKTPADVFDYAYTYILVIFLGIPVTIFYNLLASIIRALGDSRHPVLFLVTASFVNIGLDLLFILVFHMGVFGAALATVISQGVSGVCCLVYILRSMEMLRFKPRETRPDRHFMHTLLAMGLPMGLQYSITAIGAVILQTAVNGLGSDSVAAVTAAGRVSMFLSCPYDAMGQTMSTWGGQHVGAKKLERVNAGLRDCILLGSIYSIIAFFVVFLFGRSLAALFLGAGEVAVLDRAHRYLMINSAFYIPLALVNIIRFLIQGIGFPTFAILAGVCEMFARILVALALVPALGFFGVCFANPCAWIAADLFLIPAYRYEIRKLKRLFSAETRT